MCNSSHCLFSIFKEKGKFLHAILQDLYMTVFVRLIWGSRELWLRHSEYNPKILDLYPWSNLHLSSSDPNILICFHSSRFSEDFAELRPICKAFYSMVSWSTLCTVDLTSRAPGTLGSLHFLYLQSWASLYSSFSGLWTQSSPTPSNLLSFFLVRNVVDSQREALKTHGMSLG